MALVSLNVVALAEMAVGLGREDFQVLSACGVACAASVAQRTRQNRTRKVDAFSSCTNCSCTFGDQERIICIGVTVIVEALS